MEGKLESELKFVFLSCLQAKKLSNSHNNAFCSFAVEYTNKWYVNQDEQICQQDCIEGAPSSTCGGHAESWNTLYDTPDLCCAHKLYWLPQTVCVQKSLMQSVTGSEKWYVDWVLQKVSFCTILSPTKKLILHQIPTHPVVYVGSV